MNIVTPKSISYAGAKSRYGILRGVDHVAGSMLLAFWGLMRRKSKSHLTTGASFSRVLLIKFDGIGDIVLTTAIARDIKNAYPNARVTLLCGPFNHCFAQHLEVFDDIVCFSVATPWKTISQLRARKPDICLDLGNWSRVEAVLACSSGAQTVIGFSSRGQHRHYGYDLYETLESDRHELENYRAILRRLDLPAANPPDLTLREGSTFLASVHPATERFVVIHMWSGSDKWACLKEWPLDRWIAMVHWMAIRGIVVYVAGSSSERPRFRTFEDACEAQRLLIRSAIGLPFPQLMGLMKKASAVLAIDSSVAHIAGALGVPTVSLHGPTSSKRWGAMGNHVLSLDSECPGCGYMRWGSDSNRRAAKLPCMASISVEKVQGALDKVLAVRKYDSGVSGKKATR